MKKIKIERFQRITSLKVKRALERSGLAQDKQSEIFGALFPRKKASKELKIKRTAIARIASALRSDGKCGLVLTVTGKVMVIKAENVTFDFNFNDPEILAKAQKNRMGEVAAAPELVSAA